VGVGMSMGGFIVTIGMFDVAEVALELQLRRTITHYNTWEDSGQGGDIGTLTHTVKALEPLGIKASQVKMVMNDSKTCPDTGLAAASRSHYSAGLAHHRLPPTSFWTPCARKTGPIAPMTRWPRPASDQVMWATTTSSTWGSTRDSIPTRARAPGSRRFMYCVNFALVEVDVKTVRPRRCGSPG